MGLPNPSRKTKFSGANADREIFIFSVELTTWRIGNLTRLVHALATCVTLHTCFSLGTPPRAATISFAPHAGGLEEGGCRDTLQPTLHRKPSL